jgi:uncharacterized membrane protein
MDLIPSSGPHLHILLNHLPSLGSVVALGLYLLSFYLKSEKLQQASIMTFLALALLAIPTYLSGAASRWAIQNRADLDIMPGLIFAHQNAAVIACLFIGLTGSFSWFALWQYRRWGKIPDWNKMSILVFGALTVIQMIRTGSIGGRISHPEVRSGLEAVSAPGEPGAITFAENIITGNNWAWPAMEAAHFIGLALIFGTIMLVSLRVLGFARNTVSYPAMHRLLPLGALGLIANVITGMFFFIGDSGRYVAMDGFPPKIMFLMIGGFAMIYFTSFDGPWKLKAGDDASIFSKLMALVVLGSWAAVVIFGRLLPYYGGGG